MINSPNQNQCPRTPRRSLWLLILSRGGIAIGGLLIVGLMGGIWRLWTFVQKELTPLAQESLTTTLNRPVQLGRVTNFSLTGVRFAESSIPATPTDPDRVTVDAVEVGFNPLLLVFNRQLKLNVTLVNPDVYIEQDNQGRWLTTTIAPPGEKGAIQTDLENVNFRNGKLMLLPQVRNEGAINAKLNNLSPHSLPPIGFSQLNGSAQLLEKNQLIKFKAGGTADSGGNVALDGELRPQTTAANLQLRGQELLATDITRLVKLPLSLETGRVNGDLRIQLEPGQETLLYGSADLQKVTVQIPRAPQLLTNTTANVYFQGTEVKLENAVANYGSIPLVAAGIIDTKAGYKLTGRVNGVSVANAQKTLNINLPVPVTGQLQANLQVVGEPTKPILSGTVSTINTARIDKVDFKKITSKFEFSPNDGLVSLRDVQGQTTIGGEINGGGRILLGENPQLNLNFAARNVAGNAIAKLYDTNTAWQIGTVSATAQVTGAPTNVSTLVKFAAPKAVYPATGEVIIGANRNINFRNVALKVGGGTVRGYGSFANERWQAVAQASSVNLTPFVNQNQLQNISLAGAQFNGRVILTGTAAPFQIASIRTEGAGVQIGGGTIAVSNIQLQDQAFAARLVANNVRLARILKNAPPALANPIAGTFQVVGNRENFSLNTLQATGDARLSVGNGTISAANIQLVKGVYQAQVQANNVPVQRLAALPPQFQGNLTGKFDVAGSAESFSPQAIQASGQARLNVGNGTINAANIQVANGKYQAQIQANNVPVQRLAAVSPQFQGNLTGKFDVAAESFSPQAIQASGQARLNVGNGTITAANIQVANGNYQAQVQANNVPVQRLAAVPPQFQGDLTGQLNLAGSVASFSPQAIQASGQVRLNVGNGTITAANIQVANGNYQAQVQANNVPVQRLAAVPPQFQGDLTGQLNLAGSVASFSPQTIQASGQGQLNVAGGGIINASNIQLAKGRYQAVVAAAGVQLNRFNQQLKGQLGGQLQLAGNLGSTRLADVSAAGQVQLSQGIPGVERPLTAAIAWNGERLTIQQATAPGLNVTGDILANASKPGIPEITALNLNIQAQDFSLQQLPITLPNQVAVAGRMDFNGQVTGRLPLPNVNGQFTLKDLVVQNIAFERLLTGNIQSAAGKGLNFNLAGNSDRLALNLDGNNRPQSFLVQRQQALASGQVKGNDWAVKVANFPLALLNLSPPPNLRLGAGRVAGLATGDVQFNQNTFNTNGNIAIANPELGRIKGDGLTAQFRYSNGTATLTSSEFTKGNSRYALTGNFGQTPQGPRIQGKLNVTQGNIQDVLEVAQIFDFQDFQRNGAEPNYGNASDLNTYSQGLPNQPLFDQIKRFYEIDALVAKQEQERNGSPIPNLADLQGTFNGDVTVDTATANGLAVQFNLNGQNFVWGQETEPNRFYRADNIIAEGNFTNGVLQLRPVRIESENSLVAFTGNIGGSEQSGQLRVNNFPIQLLNNFVNLPVGVTGNVTGTAALAGSIANPQARGELQITDGTLNQNPIESATASFSYGNGRLNFGSTVAITGPQPVNIAGSIPYQLPFASVAPDSNQISLDVKVENEGLALFNLLSNQVTFEKGEGEIDLTVRGTRDQPIVNGIATIKDATFSAQALPGKIRGVTGRILFNFDQILVESLQGRFSRGQVQAAGAIPVFDNNSVAVNNPLTVNLDQLTLNLKGLYQGGASGNLQITGSALNPSIGGKVGLYDGQVLLAESTDNNQPTNNVSNISLTKFNKQNTPPTESANTSFNNLELVLGKNLQITRPPLLSFDATGNLTVNGSFADPIPVGTIQLRKGGVNLFTTQFNLTRGYEHTATFRANQPRDPDLDIQLLAKVVEVVQNSDLSRLNPVGLGALDTVRVEANIKGPASRLNESLELRSSPSRSETELVALLGGGFVDTQGRGDSTLGLINIAGSAVFGNFQSAFNQIGTAFGLSELRIFPTVISDNPEAGSNNNRGGSSIELAAEAGVDISNKFSISSIKILTANDPFQWGINYRINDEFRVRASTNLEDDSRAVVEYQTRF
ncbi:translocation/assembly module TamB domain-containing protein [Anabaena subtropica]|uniref:Translocation/assembly module TamB domain-containing protein n=1 Tax=Anabaena subtropica FACHB-260 TaxID=2692884 RepID=A0ABR8CTU1_9NOST|nr:translocation/assembly module TamB domain-containing protein [Anabaena subtropica]MBD2346600.1 translocation/assembly module TamB domain-containing protein [Anabaena subtropica FACHB-260]